MKLNRISLLLVVVAGALMFFAFVAQHNRTLAADGGVQSWEHIALSVSGESVTDEQTSRQIVRLGNDGWELVDVESLVNDGTTTKVVYCFKRPK